MTFYGEMAVWLGYIGAENGRDDLKRQASLGASYTNLAQDLVALKAENSIYILKLLDCK